MAAAVTEPHLEWYPLKPRTLRVRDVGRVTPRMIRVVLTGPDLEGFRTDNFDDHVKVFLPEEGSRIPALPRVSPDGRWNLRDPALTYRDYTVRRYDPDAEELVLDFVAHDHGPAGRWALDARPGDELGVLGPRGTVHIDHGYDYHLLGADETALPAVARRLEELPRDARVFAFCEVADAEEERYIDAPAGASITWLHRGGRPLGEALLAALRDFELPEGDGYAWCAGEAVMLKPIRRHLKERGFVRNSTCTVDGYWRRGTVNHDHHEEDGDE
ncbi:siderophore-interacting protein [Nocardiopsis potens]|uniref:siderophore-interacting protein n=1 Tax=Nocardiopsis potens TaxID=1246458 RepID=UPI0003484A0B|nr:siderophore-interacting protein [Nocardiopsis potens]